MEKEYTVLTIDVDFAADPDIDYYQYYVSDDSQNQLSASQRWLKLAHKKVYNKDHARMCPDKVTYMFDLFCSALDKCSNVEFGSCHNYILHHLKDTRNLHVVNVDHHHDIVYSREQQERVEALGAEDKGCWVYWLHNYGDLSKYTWIRNEGSEDFFAEDSAGRHSVLSKSSAYMFGSPQAEAIKDITYDYIFVCFSPDYVAPQYWFLYNLFINAYERKYGTAVMVDTAITPFYRVGEEVDND